MIDLSKCLPILDAEKIKELKVVRKDGNDKEKEVIKHFISKFEHENSEFEVIVQIKVNQIKPNT
ncbi:MAG: hypothetical protein ACOZAR_05075 [Patescibacteria group bacterium]